MPQHPALPFLKSAEKGKVVTAAEAVRLVRDGDVQIYVEIWRGAGGDYINISVN